MNRYDLGAPGEEEFEPGSHRSVLRNRRGIISPREIGALEASLLAIAQARSFHQVETDTPITVALVRTLHRSWLGSLYAFAGSIRQVDLAKGNVRFAPAAYLEGSLRELDQVLLRYTPCEGMACEQLIPAIARVHAELVLVHPFREGNGRMARWIADLMALQAGFPALDWGFERDTEARREKYFAALRRGFAMDFSALEGLVEEALENAVRLVEDPRAE
jgi:cell filamentation protein